MHQQQQFLDVIDRDEAERRFREPLRLRPLEMEWVPLEDGLGRVLAEDVLSTVNVPSFDRSNFDGFAVRACDTFGASEQSPRRLRMHAEVLATGVVPRLTIEPGWSTAIATGGVLPRGADAVVMVEHTDILADQLLVHRAVTPGSGVAFAGTDISAGEVVLRSGEIMTSRETGVLAAIGAARVPVWRKPIVGVISTGDEIIEPGMSMAPGLVYDSNARIVADAVRELGADVRSFGIVRDDLASLRDRLDTALENCDVVVLSGGTSKGAGDLSYQAVRQLQDPGIVAHGVALKPGKPICLAVTHGKPVVILPGFPTSAIFTFHEFVAPVIRLMAGRRVEDATTVRARLPVKIQSEIGRTEYVLVGLVQNRETEVESGMPRSAEGAPTDPHFTAFPMGKGSGSVTAFSRADGFITIGRYTEILPAGSTTDVQLLGKGLILADLVAMGSHCIGLDYLLGRLQGRGVQTKFLAIGSTAGLDAVRRGECDLAGMHLLDPVTGQYNRPFLSSGLLLIPGYGRQQGILFRRGDPRFRSRDIRQSLDAVIADSTCLMVNRNQGSGTRVLIEQLLQGVQPAGHAIQPTSHTAVATAVAQGRADWGVAIRVAADQHGLDFLPLGWEQYDFVLRESLQNSAAIRVFCEVLRDAETSRFLASMGFRRSTE